MKSQPNPMEKALEALKTAPKCLAYARTTGQPCKNASMPNGRCKMHGGKSTGPKPKHGQRTKKTLKNMAEVKFLIRKINTI